MGLIQAAKDAVSSILADQWREFFYCDTLSDNVLVVKGKKKVNEGKNSNKKSSDNVISNGSVISVPPCRRNLRTYTLNFSFSISHQNLKDNIRTVPRNRKHSRNHAAENSGQICPSMFPSIDE